MIIFIIGFFFYITDLHFQLCLLAKVVINAKINPEKFTHNDRTFKDASCSSENYLATQWEIFYTIKQLNL